MIEDSAFDPNEPAQRLGKSMLFAAWIVGLALLGLLFDGMVRERALPNRDAHATLGADGQLELVLKRDRLGHYLAPGRINGMPVTFLLDTGATAIALPYEQAQRLRLTLRPGGMTRTANGMVRTWSTRLDAVDLGGLIRRNLAAVVMPNMPGDEVLLGMNFLQAFEIVQRANLLTLRPAH